MNKKQLINKLTEMGLNVRKERYNLYSAIWPDKGVLFFNFNTSGRSHEIETIDVLTSGANRSAALLREWNLTKEVSDIFGCSARMIGAGNRFN